MTASFLLPLFFPVLFSVISGVRALAQPPRQSLLPRSQAILEPQSTTGSGQDAPTRAPERVFSNARPYDQSSISSTLEDLLFALDVMQDEYFEVWLGTWPTSIDWTAAVMGTHVSATLAALTAASDEIVSGSTPVADVDVASEQWQLTIARNSLAFENLINRFADQIQSFYFGENAFSLRHQAYDDMLWVVLGWLENIKFQELHQELHYSRVADWRNVTTADQRWHGMQYRKPAAHRARVFYELASAGWDETLCGGGMIWNPNLVPYKNAITNELFIAASIAMYLYFPGDPIDSPFVEKSAAGDRPWKHARDPAHLEAAINGYEWLKRSNMTTADGLYADGFHISGWRSSAQPGSRKCDVLNTMVYTYNQGVILSGLRGLWLATASDEYIRDGHELVEHVMDATGWPEVSDNRWAGLGRGGVLEEACDSWGTCSQDGQTFKGIFFHHLAEFCRPVRPQEERFVDDRHHVSASADANNARADWEDSVDRHQARCRAYRPWIEHNAKAALVSRDEHGKFGTWWGRKYRTFEAAVTDSSWLPDGAIDYRNAEEGSGESKLADTRPRDYNDRGRGRTVETQAGGLAVLRALFQWLTCPSLTHSYQ